MSSIIIKGMEMPSECRECPLCQYYPMVGETRCRRTGEVLASDFGTIKFDGRSELCRLVELPEKHGDLIDRDTLIRDLTNGIKAGLLLDGYEEYPNINNADDCVECVKYADAVIEAEGKCE